MFSLLHKNYLEYIRKHDLKVQHMSLPSAGSLKVVFTHVVKNLPAFRRTGFSLSCVHKSPPPDTIL